MEWSDYLKKLGVTDQQVLDWWHTTHVARESTAKRIREKIDGMKLVLPLEEGFCVKAGSEAVTRINSFTYNDKSEVNSDETMNTMETISLISDSFKSSRTDAETSLRLILSLLSK